HDRCTRNTTFRSTPTPPRHTLFPYTTLFRSLGEPRELLQHHVLRRAHAVAHVHVLEAGEALLDGLEIRDELLGRAREPGADLGVVLDGRHAGRRPAAAATGHGGLLGRQARHEAERPEHLHVLLV